MQQPEGFVDQAKENLVCQMKQALRKWYQKFESFMVEHGFNKTHADHYVFVKKYEGGDFLILLLYVDDILIVGYNLKKIGSLRRGPEQVIRDEGYVSDKAVIGYAHCPRQEKEIVVAIIVEMNVANGLHWATKIPKVARH